LWTQTNKLLIFSLLRFPFSTADQQCDQIERKENVEMSKRGFKVKQNKKESFWKSSQLFAICRINKK
jgi:hypothetical protein